jgi:hypothetical protein
VVRLVGDEVRKLREKMRDAFYLAWHRFFPDQEEDEGRSERRSDSLERRDDVMDEEWCDGGNPGTVMLERYDGLYFVMAWDLEINPGINLRSTCLDPALPDKRIRERVRRLLRKHDPLGNIESFSAEHIKGLQEWASEKK